MSLMLSIADAYQLKLAVRHQQDERMREDRGQEGVRRMLNEVHARLAVPQIFAVRHQLHLVPGLATTIHPFTPTHPFH